MDRRGASGKSRGAVPLRPDPIDQFRLAADYIDRILRGEKPCCASQQKVGRRRQLWVTNGNAHNEPMLSALRPIAIAKGEVEFGCQVVIEAPKMEPRFMRYELTGYEWAAIKPFLPNKPRGVPRVEISDHVS